MEIGAGQVEGEAEAGPGPPMRGMGGQLESSRSGGNMSGDCEEPIQDVMRRGQERTAD